MAAAVTAKHTAPAVLIATLCGLGWIGVSKLCAADRTFSPGEFFAAEWNRWAQMRGARRPNELSAAEHEQWTRVKCAWRRVERQVDAQYEGFDK